MTPLRMGSAKVEGVSAEELEGRASALRDALASGGPELDAAHRGRATQVVEKVAARTSLVGGHTVVALAGATGSGKSSIFNALVGSDVARVGARRPTTSSPTAATWGDEPAGELLGWLNVGARHHVDGAGRPGAGSLDGLVLLDLPDFDSRELTHRQEAERVLDLVDVFVWVTDPQKYADARLHDDYVAALAAHDAVTVVVLNQADRLDPDALAQCKADLQRLLGRDGLSTVSVITTSARDGRGIADLRQRLTDAVTGQNASRLRLAADIGQVATRLRSGVADDEPRLGDPGDTGLVDALSRAAGIPTVVAAVEREYRREAWAQTGWPFTRWVRAFRPDPLKRLRLDRGSRRDATEVSAADVRSVLGRSSLPPASPAARSAVDLATRRLGDEAGAGLPVRWSEAVADAATPPGPEMADALDQAVIGTSLRARNPSWWSVFGVLQVLLAVITVLGLLWLLVLAGMGWLRLPEVDTPKWGPFPWPTLMFGGGLVLGLLLALLARFLALAGSRRRGRIIDRRLRSAVGVVATERIVEPVRTVLRRHAETRQSLDSARG